MHLDFKIQWLQQTISVIMYNHVHTYSIYGTVLSVFIYSKHIAGNVWHFGFSALQSRPQDTMVAAQITSHLLQ